MQDENSMMSTSTDSSNVIRLPNHFSQYAAPTPDWETPVTDKMEERHNSLNSKSKYKSDFDFQPLKDLEKRMHSQPMNGGHVFKSPFRLVNWHSTCEQCLYSFEVDTYGRGCTHNCGYCYAKAELTVHGYWNKPFPAPVDINEIRKVFYTVFETDKKSKWRKVLESRIPIRIGSMSDSFMWMDHKYGVTQEFLKILKHYDYPFIAFTRSDLIAHDDYLALLDPKRCSVHFSISSLNDEMNRMIEPGAPSAKRRLKAVRGLQNAGIWTSVRINPLFPIYPDGYFSDPNFSWEGTVPQFNYFSFDMIDELASQEVRSLIVGFGRFSAYSLNQIEKSTEFNLRQFFDRKKVFKSQRDFHYSESEISYYYSEIKKRTIKNLMEFSTCYIGNGEEAFWRYQPLWNNRKDCCNAKGHVGSFKQDARSLLFSERLEHAAGRSVEPLSTRLHEPLVSAAVELSNKKSYEIEGSL